MFYLGFCSLPNQISFFLIIIIIYFHDYIFHWIASYISIHNQVYTSFKFLELAQIGVENMFDLVTVENGLTPGSPVTNRRIFTII